MINSSSSYGDILVVFDKKDHHTTQIFISFFWNDNAEFGTRISKPHLITPYTVQK